MSDTEMHEWFLSMKDILVYNRDLMYEYGKKYEEAQMKIFKEIDNDSICGVEFYLGSRFTIRIFN